MGDEGSGGVVAKPCATVTADWNLPSDVHGPRKGLDLCGLWGVRSFENRLRSAASIGPNLAHHLLGKNSAANSQRPLSVGDSTSEFVTTQQPANTAKLKGK